MIKACMYNHRMYFCEINSRGTCGVTELKEQYKLIIGLKKILTIINIGRSGLLSLLFCNFSNNSNADAHACSCILNVEDGTVAG